MFGKKQQIKTVISILLITVFFQKSMAQDNTLDFLNDYYCIGAFAQYTVDRAGVVYKQDPNLNYDLLEFSVPQLGIVINRVYQYKNFNFKTGLILKYKLIKEHLLFTKEQTGLEYDSELLSSLSSDDKIISIPLISEYVIPLSHRIKWVIGSSFSIGYYRGQEGGSVHIRGVHQNRTSLYIYYDGYDKNPLFTSAEISTGFYFLFKHFMLQPEIRYSKSFRDVLTGHYVTENFVTEPHNSSGTFKQSGDYWGISLSVYIKKRGKNKKRKTRKK